MLWHYLFFLFNVITVPHFFTIECCYSPPFLTIDCCYSPSFFTIECCYSHLFLYYQMLLLTSMTSSSSSIFSVESLNFTDLVIAKTLAEQIYFHRSSPDLVFHNCPTVILSHQGLISSPQSQESSSQLSLSRLSTESSTSQSYQGSSILLPLQRTPLSMKQISTLLTALSSGLPTLLPWRWIVKLWKETFSLPQNPTCPIIARPQVRW